MNRNFFNDKNKSNPKFNMKDVTGAPDNWDWEAYSRKLDKDLESKKNKMIECVKLHEVSDPYRREELNNEIEKLQDEILFLLVESLMAVVPTAAYKLKQENIRRLN